MDLSSNNKHWKEMFILFKRSDWFVLDLNWMVADDSTNEVTKVTVA